MKLLKSNLKICISANSLTLLITCANGRMLLLNKVDKKHGKVAVIMDCGLELELSKAEIDSPNEEVLAKFQSKTEPLPLDRVKKLKESIDKNNNSKGVGDVVISRKSSKSKKQVRNQNATQGESEMKNQSDLSLEEIMKSTSETSQPKEPVNK